MKNLEIDYLIESIHEDLQEDSFEFNPDCTSLDEIVHDEGYVLVGNQPSVPTDKDTFKYHLEIKGNKVLARPQYKEVGPPFFFKLGSGTAKKKRKGSYVIYYVQVYGSVVKRHSVQRDSDGNIMKKRERGHYDNLSQEFEYDVTKRTNNYNDIDSELGQDERLQQEELNVYNIVYSIKNQPVPVVSPEEKKRRAEERAAKAERRKKREEDRRREILDIYNAYRPRRRD